MNKFKKILPIFSALLSAGLANIANAAIAQPPISNITAVVTKVNGAGGVVGVVCSIASWWLFFTMILAVIFGVWAAWKYVQGEGVDAKNTEARRMFQYALIGVAIGLVALGIPTIAGDFLGLTNVGKGSCSFLP